MSLKHWAWQIRQGESELEKYTDYFFRANNNSNLFVDVVNNDQGVLGLLVQNKGGGVQTTDEFDTNGFEINQDTQKIDGIKMSYYMQGASEDSNICSDTAGIYLNGPGFEKGGTNADKLYPSPSWINVIQGKYEPNRDESISVIDHEETDVSIETIFGFSGSGTENDIVPECARSEFIPKIDGEYAPATFFTSLLIDTSKTPKCKIPDDAADQGYEVSCSGGNIDELYSPTQCSVSCADDFAPNGLSDVELICSIGDEFFSLVGCSPIEDLKEFYEPFEKIEDFNSRFNLTLQV